MERSPAEPTRFPRGRLAVGLVLVTIVAAGVAFASARLRGGPDPGRVVYASEGGVFVRDLASRSTRRITGLPGDTLAAWPDREGRWIGYLRRRGDLWLLDLDRRTRWRVSERLSVGAGWTLDGRFVASELLSDRDLVAVDPVDRGSHLLVSGYTGGRIVWRNSAEFLTVVGDDLVGVRTSGARPKVRKIVADAWPLAVSPDGRELLYVRDPAGPHSRVFIGRLKGSKVTDSRLLFRGLAYSAGVSPQGFVAFSGRDRKESGGTWVIESFSRPPRRVSSVQAETVGWSLDGSTLVYATDRLFAVDLSDHRTVPLSRRGDFVRAFSIVP